MQPFDIILLALSGLLAGAINSVAGGGTFFTFSALLTVGLPPIVANATSSIAVGPGSVASALAYIPEVKSRTRRILVLGVVSVLGSLVGALILIRFSNDAFSRLIPYLLLGATLLFAASPYLAKLTRSAAGQTRSSFKSSPLKYLGGCSFSFLSRSTAAFLARAWGL